MLVDIYIIMWAFIKKVHILNINKLGENNHKSRCACMLYENYLLSFLSLLVKRFDEEIQPSGDRVDNTGG